LPNAEAENSKLLERSGDNVKHAVGFGKYKTPTLTQSPTAEALGDDAVSSTADSRQTSQSRNQTRQEKSKCY